MHEQEKANRWDHVECNVQKNHLFSRRLTVENVEKKLEPFFSCLFIMNIRFYCTHFYQSSSAFLPVAGRVLQWFLFLSAIPSWLFVLKTRERKRFFCGNLIRRMKWKEAILKTALKVYMTEASTWINLINARHLNDCCFCSQKLLLMSFVVVM